MEDRTRLVSETPLAGVEIAGFRQTNTAAKGAILRASNRHTGRVEHDATHRKQRIGYMSTRHNREGSRCS